MRIFSRSDRERPATAKKTAKRPKLEGLEDRLLLYSTTGGLWSHGSRITYSFAPDGTSVGGTPSALFQTLDAKYSTATWQNQIRRAAAVWQAVADINVVEVPDNGAAIGSAGNQQGDANFGDIRFAGIAQSPSALGFAFLPPPFNGGSAAGDVVFNTAQNWQINNDYDLQTVAIHEIGHALGMGHSAISNAVMYAAYNSIKQSLNSDDIAGIQSIYSARQNDVFDASAANNSWSTATEITSYIDSNAQIRIAELDITTTSDSDWYKVVVPAGTNGTLTAQVQSTNLSSLSPRVQVYTSGLVSRGFQSLPNTYGATASVTITGVTAGQTYYIRASNANSGPTGTGGYGLLVNFGNQALAAIDPPNTTVAAQPDQGGGTMNESTGRGKGRSVSSESGETILVDADSTSASSGETHYELVIGTLRGWGEYLTIEGHDHDGDEHHDEGDADDHDDAIDSERNWGGWGRLRRFDDAILGSIAELGEHAFSPLEVRFESLIQRANRKR
ncbi:MAG: matrixin family metalloprotease [Isosphaeraceae bacterium]|nr:matrixin family metalloprotease [Isosphaeraceae bacterium]